MLEVAVERSLEGVRGMEEVEILVLNTTSHKMVWGQVISIIILEPIS